MNMPLTFKLKAGTENVNQCDTLQRRLHPVQNSCTLVVSGQKSCLPLVLHLICKVHYSSLAVITAAQLRNEGWESYSDLKHSHAVSIECFTTYTHCSSPLTILVYSYMIHPQDSTALGFHTSTFQHNCHPKTLLGSLMAIQ